MGKLSKKSELFGLVLFNLLLGIACLIQIVIALMFDFPYKAWYYSDYALGHLLALIIFSVVWNFFHFIRLVIKSKQDHKQDNMAG